MDVDNYEEGWGGCDAVVLVCISVVLKDPSFFRLRQSKNSDLISKLMALRLSETSVTANRTTHKFPKRRQIHTDTTKLHIPEELEYLAASQLKSDCGNFPRRSLAHLNC